MVMFCRHYPAVVKYCAVLQVVRMQSRQSPGTVIFHYKRINFQYIDQFTCNLYLAYCATIEVILLDPVPVNFITYYFSICCFAVSLTILTRTGCTGRIQRKEQSSVTAVCGEHSSFAADSLATRSTM